MKFLFGFASNSLWTMIEGIQILVYYPMFRVDSPANIGLLQAILRNVAGFELIDNDIIQQYVWRY